MEEKKINKETRIAIITIVALCTLLCVLAFGSRTDYIIIDGDEVIEYEIIDGNTIIIHTEDEQYRVDFFDVVIDFTINSNTTIELSKNYFWNNPTSDGYWLNRIIKVPDGGE